MSRADRFLRLTVATIAVSPLLLAGCAALSVDRPKEPVAQLPNRPGLVRLAIAQLQYGNSAPFQVCVGDACPKPTQQNPRERHTKIEHGRRSNAGRSTHDRRTLTQAPSDVDPS